MKIIDKIKRFFKNDRYYAAQCSAFFSPAFSGRCRLRRQRATAPRASYTSFVFSALNAPYLPMNDGKKKQK